jgi:hypothetical protein
MVVTRLLLLFTQCALTAGSVAWPGMPSGSSRTPPALIDEIARRFMSMPDGRRPSDDEIARQVMSMSDGRGSIDLLDQQSTKFPDVTEAISAYADMAQELTEEEKDLYLIKTTPRSLEHALELFVGEALLYQKIHVEQIKVLEEMNTDPKAHEALAAHFAKSETTVGKVYFDARQEVAWTNALIRFAGWIARNPGKRTDQVDRLFEMVFNLYRKDLDEALEGVLPLFTSVPEYLEMGDNSSLFTWIVLKVREICNPPPSHLQQEAWFHDRLNPSVLFYGAASHIMLPFIRPETKLRVAWNKDLIPVVPKEIKAIQREAVKLAWGEKGGKLSFEAYEKAWDKVGLIEGYSIIADCADESVTDVDFERSFFSPLVWQFNGEFLHVKRHYPWLGVKANTPEPPVAPKLQQTVSNSKNKTSKKQKKLGKKARLLEEIAGLVQGIPLTFSMPSLFCCEVTDELPIKERQYYIARLRREERTTRLTKFRWFRVRDQVIMMSYDEKVKKEEMAERTASGLEGKSKSEKSEGEKVKKVKKVETDEQPQKEMEPVAKKNQEELEMKETAEPEEGAMAAGPSMPIAADEISNLEKAVSKEEAEEVSNGTSSIEDDGKAVLEHYALEKKKAAQMRKVFRQQQVDQESSNRRERVRNNMKAQPASSSSSSQAPTEVSRLDSDQLCLEFSEAYKVFLSNKNICSINAKGFRWHFDKNVVIKDKHMNFLCTLFNMMPGKSQLTFDNMVKVYWAIEQQLNNRSARLSTISGSKVFKWSHQFLIKNVLVSPSKMEVHPEHESSGFNHVQARALFSGGGFDPRFFSPE